MTESTPALPQRPWRQRYHVAAIGWTLLLAVLLVLSSLMTGANFGTFLSNIDQFLALLVQMSHPAWSYLHVILQPLYETIQMAVLGTTIGAVLAVPFALLAASNLVGNRLLRGLIRFFLDLVRTLPDLLLAAIFVAIFGIGSTAGVITLAIFSFGMVSKLFYEVIETIDMGPLEALKSVGATKVTIIWYAVLPQILNQFVSYFLYTLEINVRASTVLGYLGAGGIGVYLQRSLGEFNYSATAVIILATLVVVLVIDGISNHLRRVLL
ncbi:phosphonate ABC transporter, permease protein PhnE [Levilactobacillus acidifarinae]|uniref:ABC-type phosphate phosphonate transport system, permease component n=1 Tax=Levilactobacillus acidifarinae DSM 19394 = JCM 15949 TaxID=1423715 RepID=A0A0R1LSB0_9LACO|nr:phosphonate ABC transporter, permease protein PhnE [Levilactobacillus acidifarinae]KRK96084.1 ABC-type phosphate phosphonate transport system, permease component [Levilactobacillus acidifarinae DSM 19394]GEO69642.1 phosphonate ABC transporter, permease protein PhnE [Levilactobacillus acidifarinae]